MTFLNAPANKGILTAMLTGPTADRDNAFFSNKCKLCEALGTIPYVSWSYFTDSVSGGTQIARCRQIVRSDLPLGAIDLSDEVLDREHVHQVWMYPHRTEQGKFYVICNTNQNEVSLDHLIMTQMNWNIAGDKNWLTYGIPSHRPTDDAYLAMFKPELFDASQIEQAAAKIKKYLTE